MLRVSIKHFFFAVLLLSLFWPQIAFATDPPNLISPADNSTEIKSPKLTWEYSGECIESGSCFKVEIDNSPDFSSPEKSTYTNSLSYSPQGLTESSWNWRVKAKDKSGTWSDWSRALKFSISPQVIASSAPSVSSPPSTSTPSPSAASQKAENVFNIKDTPFEINSDREFEVSVSLKLPDKPNTYFYLKGAFKKEGSSNYFGESFADEWIKNNEKYSRQLKISTDSSGVWEGKIKVRPDQNDSGFDGTDNYIFKVARYSDSGSGPAWSNELTIKIKAVDIPKSSSSLKDEPEEEVENNKDIDLSASLVRIPSKNYEIKIASVAGEATKSDNIGLVRQTEILEDKKINWVLVLLGLGILGGGIYFAYYKITYHKQIIS